MGFSTKKTILFQGFRGDPTFSRDFHLFLGGGPNAYFYRKPYNL